MNGIAVIASQLAQRHIVVLDTPLKVHHQAVLIIILARLRYYHQWGTTFRLTHQGYSQYRWDMYVEACEDARGEKYVTDEFDHIPPSPRTFTIPVTIEAYDIESGTCIFAVSDLNTPRQLGICVAFNDTNHIDAPIDSFGLWAFEPIVDEDSDGSDYDYGWVDITYPTHTHIRIDDPLFRVELDQVETLLKSIRAHSWWYLSSIVGSDYSTHLILEYCDFNNTPDIQVGGLHSQLAFRTNEWPEFD